MIESISALPALCFVAENRSSSFTIYFSNSNGVSLIEGEIKALLATQAWRAGDLSVPAVAQPGISILQAEMIEALAGKRVYLLYDSEARKDPFALSPGERHTILNGEKLTSTLSICRVKV